jgi:PKD repeat protein
MGPSFDYHFGNGYVWVHELIHNAGREEHSTDTENVMHESPRADFNLIEIGGYRIANEDGERLKEFGKKHGISAYSLDQKDESQSDTDQVGSAFDHVPREGALAFWYAGLRVVGQDVFAVAFTQELIPRDEELILGFRLKINVDGDDNTGYTEGEFIGVDDIHTIIFAGMYPFATPNGEMFGFTDRYRHDGHLVDSVPIDPAQVSLEVASMVSFGDDVLPLFDIISLEVHVENLAENARTWVIGLDYNLEVLNSLTVDLFTITSKPEITNGPFQANTGDIIQLFGSGFEAFNDVEILLQHELLTLATTNSIGDFQAEIMVPNVPSGDYMVDALQNHLIAITIITINSTTGEEPTQKPIANFTWSPAIPTIQDLTTFADTSQDDEGVVAWFWSLGDGSTSSEQNPTHQYSEDGTYAVQLMVTDADQNTDFALKNLLIENLPPVADFTYSPIHPMKGDVIHFSDTSIDPEGQELSFFWDFGDETTGTGKTITHNYTIPGTYTVMLTVMDGVGNSDNHSFTITYAAQVVRKPQSVYVVAVVGTAVTAVMAALANLGSLGQAFDSLVSKQPIPDKLKGFLKLYGKSLFETIDKVELEILERTAFITKGDLVSVGISILILTIVFGFVEANGFPHFLNPSIFAAVIPSTLLSACMGVIAKEFSEVLCFRTYRVYKQYRLWMYGLGVFLVSGLLFQFPFGYPGVTRYQSRKISNKTKGLLVLSKMLVRLTMAIPFAGLYMVGFKILGDAGLLMTLTAVCFSLVPLKPLAGKAVLDYKPEVSLTAFISAAILLYSISVNLLPYVVYLAVGVVSAFLATITLNQLRKTHPK